MHGKWNFDYGEYKNPITLLFRPVCECTCTHSHINTFLR